MAEHKTSIDKENLTTTATSVFKAPLAKVWDACTNPELVAKWWGPDGYTTEVVEHDFKEGGKWRNEQIAPDGSRYVFYGEFREIKPQEKPSARSNLNNLPGM